MAGKTEVMKTESFLTRRVTALFLWSLLLVVALPACDDDKGSVNNSPNITGNASGLQIVPSVCGEGAGTINGKYDASNRSLTYTSNPTYTSNWSALTAVPLSGFYNGASGVSGTAMGTPWTFESNATGTGSITGAMTLPSEHAQQLHRETGTTLMALQQTRVAKCADRFRWFDKLQMQP
jgi:hypothetical protein